LGEGTYGVVFKAREKATGKIVALKKIKLENEENGMPSTSLREITVLKELRHPNIVQLYTIVYQDKHNLQLVFEFLDYDLKKHMENATEGMPAEVVRSYMYQLLSGMRYCHARRIIHRDLKPQNLLIDANGTLKIADFGLARCFGVPLRNYTHELFKIFQVLGTPDEQIWPGVHDLPDYKPHFPKWPKSSLELYADKLGTAGVDLLDGLLTYFPGQRTSAARALQHPQCSVSHTDREDDVLGKGMVTQVRSLPCDGDLGGLRIVGGTV
ncbi:cell division control protein 28, partial [Catenaria anguillulae PL171]